MVSSGPVDLAVIVPCHNEEAAITKVVTDLRAALPGARIYVYDNRSTDRTAELAAEAGAIVRREEVKGKGNVVRRAFADVEAEVYVMIDGDDTYDAAAAPGLVQTLLEGPYDHVLSVREQTSDAAYRPGHSAGNRAFNMLVGRAFGYPVSDMLSGYRAFSRRFVKSFPAVSREFEIETELTIHAITLRVPQTEVGVGFRERAEGSASKLNTVRDGLKILSLIVNLIRHERPLLFHGLLSALLVLLAVLFGLPILIEFFQTGLVPRVPTVILVAVLFIVAAMLAVVGGVLDAVTRARREFARLSYLRTPAPGAALGADGRPPGHAPGSDSAGSSSRNTQ